MAEAVEAGLADEGDRGRVGEGEGRRLEDRRVGVRERVLGDAATVGRGGLGVDLVAGLERGDGGADGDDGAGEVCADFVGEAGGC